jgi:glycosyl transferase family 87
VVISALAIVATTIGVASLLQHADAVDFGSFYASGRDWISGEPPYTTWPARSNMNPPLFTLVAFGWLAHLPILWAAAIWTALGLASLLGTIQVLRRTFLWTPAFTWASTAVMLLTFPAQLVWQRGQVVWVLLYPATRAWLAFREGRETAAGVWLAPLIALKPILAIVPFFLGLRTLLCAGIGSALLAALGIAITGWTSWHAWMQAGVSVYWYAWPYNASIWSVMLRAIGVESFQQVPLAVLPGWLTGLVVLLAIVFGTMTARTTNADRRWVLAHLFMLLFVPLGWIYYVPLLFGPLCVITRSSPSPWLWAGIAALMIPLPVFRLWTQDTPWLFATVGSLYAWALVALFVGHAVNRQTKQASALGT